MEEEEEFESAVVDDDDEDAGGAPGPCSTFLHKIIPFSKRNKCRCIGLKRRSFRPEPLCSVHTLNGPWVRVAEKELWIDRTTIAAIAVANR